MAADNKDIQRFNEEASSYEALSYQGLFFDRVHRALLAAIPPDSRPETIVDIGCGTGRLLRRLAQRWPAALLTGVDPAEGMLAEARRLTPGVTFYLGMAENLPLEDGSVELVTSTISFHHWQDQAAGLVEVRRILRPGGRFVLADFSMPLGLNHIMRHGRQVSASRMRRMFEQAGLEVKYQRRAVAGFVVVTAGTLVGTRSLEKKSGVHA